MKTKFVIVMAVTFLFAFNASKMAERLNLTGFRLPKVKLRPSEPEL